MISLARYWHTLRYLRPVQFYGRLWFRLYKPMPAQQSAPRLHSLSDRWALPAARRSSLVDSATFCFLNETHSLDDIGWDSAAIEKLWRYNLHYFDDLNASSAPMRCGWHFLLLTRWVKENLPGKGTGWEPYPVSLRIVNWVKWVLAGNELPLECVQSLAMQVRWLEKRLEVHLQGNHLFANAKALIFAGLFFTGAEADGWLKKGLRILLREVPEQVLADGGHFERSTMYHALALEDILDLINAAQAWSGSIDAGVLAGWSAVAGRMLLWLKGLLHPDGQFALFNDAAFGIAPEPSLLLDYAARLGIQSPHLESEKTLMVSHWPESGYIHLASPEAVALLDVAPVGPDYLPGHAHADTLSFELSLFGQRVVVNGGTSCYGAGAVRVRERETVSHSTVEVDALSSSEVWSTFRVARRAFPFGLQIIRGDGTLAVSCSHNGYTRLAGKPVHHREWVMDAKSVLVSDCMAGGTHSAVARFIFHPLLQVSILDKNLWLLVLPLGGSVRVSVLSGLADIEPSHYAPEFGRVLPTQCLAVSLVNGQAVTQFIWD